VTDVFLADGGGGGPLVSGESFQVKQLPVAAIPTSGLTAAQIQEYFSSLQPEWVAQAGTAHTATAAVLRGVADRAATHAQKIVANWDGVSAQAALSAMQQLHSTATQLAQAANQTGHVLTTLAGVLPEYVSWQPPALTMTAAQSTVAAHNPSALPGIIAGLQQQQNQAAQQKLTELNGHLVAANAALPASVNVNMPKPKPGAGGGSPTGVAAGGSAVAGGGFSLTGSRSGGGGPAGGGAPAPAPRTPAPITVSQAPIPVSPGPNPGPLPVTPPTTGPTQVFPLPTAPGPQVQNFNEPDPTAPAPGEPDPILPGPTTSGGPGPNTAPETVPQGQDPALIPGATDGAPAVGDVPPGSFFPGSAGSGGGFPLTGDSFTSGGFSTPGLGNGVGEGLMPGDGPFGVMPGDTAVMGPDGMIGLPGADPAIGGFGGGGFANDGFVGGGFDGSGEVVGGGSADGVLPGGGAEGAFPDGEIASADVSAADGVGGLGYGLPMGSGAGSGNDEQDRYRESWLNEDAELWNGGVRLAPSLIGR
jgi:hypothetical protein